MGAPAADFTHLRRLSGEPCRYIRPRRRSHSRCRRTAYGGTASTRPHPRPVAAVPRPELLSFFSAGPAPGPGRRSRRTQSLRHDRGSRGPHPQRHPPAEVGTGCHRPHQRQQDTLGFRNPRRSALTAARSGQGSHPRRIVRSACDGETGHRHRPSLARGPIPRRCRPRDVLHALSRHGRRGR